MNLFWDIGFISMGDRGPADNNLQTRTNWNGINTVQQMQKQLLKLC